MRGKKELSLDDDSPARHGHGHARLYVCFSVMDTNIHVSAFIHTESACDINDILGRNVEPAEGEAVLR